MSARRLCTANHRRNTLSDPSGPSQASVASNEPAQSRRGFLAWLSGVGGAISGILVGVPLLRAFVTPGLSTTAKDDWIKVADDVALIDVDVPVRVTFVVSKQDAWIESRSLNSVWLYTTDGERFKAYNAHCTHLGCGFVYQEDTKRFFCPCHRGQFDPKTGAVLDGPPPRALDELKVQVRDSAVYVLYKEFRLGIPERVEV